MRLLLIRHGETRSNVDHLLDTAHPGAPLNETGLQQAEDLVAALADEPIDALYVSTLTRAQETGAPLGRALGLEPRVLAGLHEIQAGSEELKNDWTHYLEVLSSWSLDNLDVGLDGGETAREFLARYSAAIAAIESDGHQSVAVITHGAAMRVWALYQDLDWGMERAAPLANTDWIVLEGSTADGWRIQRWGSAPGQSPIIMGEWAERAGSSGAPAGQSPQQPPSSAH